MNGGAAGTDLAATDSSTVTAVGRDFEGGGVPVRYGNPAAEERTLSGVLASGDPLKHCFRQGQSGGSRYTGTATLRSSEPVPSLPQWGLITFGLVLLTAMAWALRRRRAAWSSLYPAGCAAS